MALRYQQRPAAACACSPGRCQDMPYPMRHSPSPLILYCRCWLRRWADEERRRRPCIWSIRPINTHNRKPSDPQAVHWWGSSARGSGFVEDNKNDGSNACMDRPRFMSQAHWCCMDLASHLHGRAPLFCYLQMPSRAPLSPPPPPPPSRRLVNQKQWNEPVKTLSLALHHLHVADKFSGRVECRWKRRIVHLHRRSLAGNHTSQP